MKFLNRFKENTSWLGLGAIIAGVGEVAKINEAPQVAETVAEVGAQVVTGNYVGAVGLIFAGIVGFFKKDTGARD